MFQRVDFFDTQQKILLIAIFFVNVFIGNKVPIFRARLPSGVLKSALSEGQCDSPSYFVRGTFFPEPFAIVRNFRFIDSLQKTRGLRLLFFCTYNATISFR